MDGTYKRVTQETLSRNKEPEKNKKIKTQKHAGSIYRSRI